MNTLNGIADRLERGIVAAQRRANHCLCVGRIRRMRHHMSTASRLRAKYRSLGILGSRNVVIQLKALPRNHEALYHRYLNATK